MSSAERERELCRTMGDELLRDYQGQCHCGKVHFTFKAPADKLTVWKCNCSICHMRQNDHVVVPESYFTLGVSSAEYLTEYTFNTHTAKHLFCRVCGIASFYRPRSNPDGYGITIHCVTDPPAMIETKEFDGQNWEGFIDRSGIREHSKVK